MSSAWKEHSVNSNMRDSARNNSDAMDNRHHTNKDGVSGRYCSFPWFERFMSMIRKNLHAELDQETLLYFMDLFLR